MRCLFCGYDYAENGGAEPGKNRFRWQWDWRCSCGFAWAGEYEYGRFTYGFGTDAYIKRVEVSEGVMVVFGEVGS